MNSSSCTHWPICKLLPSSPTRNIIIGLVGTKVHKTHDNRPGTTKVMSKTRVVGVLAMCAVYINSLQTTFQLKSSLGAWEDAPEVNVRLTNDR